MSTEDSAQRPTDAFANWVRGVVPPGCTPTGWCHKPIHRHVVEKAPDVVAATSEAISESFGDVPHVIVEVRADDAAARENDELAQALARTDGGVLLVGVGYEDPRRP